MTGFDATAALADRLRDMAARLGPAAARRIQARARFFGLTATRDVAPALDRLTRLTAQLRWPLVVVIPFGVLIVAKAAMTIDDLASRAPAPEVDIAARSGASAGFPGDVEDWSWIEPGAGPADDAEPETGTAAPLPQEAEASEPLILDPESLTESELVVLQSLAERRQQLDQRALELDQREAELRLAEAKVDAQVERLAALKLAIEALMKEHDAVEEAKLARLVKIYEKMKAKNAAEVFDRLEMQVLIEVVSRMREASSSAIMARMDPAKAKLLTAELARRTRLPQLDPANQPAQGPN